MNLGLDPEDLGARDFPQLEGLDDVTGLQVLEV
jgi:hypothetical protein